MLFSTVGFDLVTGSEDLGDSFPDVKTNKFKLRLFSFLSLKADFWEPLDCSSLLTRTFVFSWIWLPLEITCVAGFFLECVPSTSLGFFEWLICDDAIGFCTSLDNDTEDTILMFRS